MYTLQRLLDDLLVGELSQIGLALNDRGSDAETYDKAAIKAIVSHLNIALDTLYTRFPLRTREMVIQQDESITKYFLLRRFAKSNLESQEPIKYIIDSEEMPFTEDVLRIDGVYDEVGNGIPVNEPTKVNSVFTPSHNCIQIPYPLSTNATTIIYRAKHGDISYTGDISPADMAIDIPSYLYEALQVYIAYRINRARNSLHSQNTAMQSLALFEKICEDVENKNMTNDENVPESTVFIQNGWV